MKIRPGDLCVGCNKDLFIGESDGPEPGAECKGCGALYCGKCYADNIERGGTCLACGQKPA